MKSDLQRLQEFTKECRLDMHEPDEQNVYAEYGPTVVMSGKWVCHPNLDNACPGEAGLEMGFWLIKKGKYPDGSGEDREWFNLANIIALARRAV